MVSRLNSTLFSSSGTWLCPAGVTKIKITGGGGGGGGGGGMGSNGATGFIGFGGGGGGAAIITTLELTVVPGTSYTVTIPAASAGGAGGAAFGTGDGGAIGTNGGDVIFGASLVIFFGANAGSGGSSGISIENTGGLPVKGHFRAMKLGSNYFPQLDAQPGAGGHGAQNTDSSMVNPEGGIGNGVTSGSGTGNPGTDSGSYYHGGGGGGGGCANYPAAVGGTGGSGGNGNNAGNPQSGGVGLPGNGFCSGGGGGGASGSGTSFSAVGGNGGAGAKGFVLIEWIE